ncbi:peptidoglycan-binding protein [Streptomyces sp. NPDC002138]|uniref:peptidoglycan-binding domain-containing protein n=1 Tax=Streptomyces sp. NPDC002138 TaxID=3154410 RepID=UPI0033347D72
MPHHPDESGPVFDDRLLVRPYVARGGRPRRTTPRRPGAPVWPQHGSGLGPGPGPAEPTVAAPAAHPLPAPGTRPTGTETAAGRREHGTRNALVVLGLLALLTTGTLLALLHSPPEAPPRAVRPPAASGPGLLARNPEAEDPAASSTGSVHPSVPAPSASAPAVSGATPAPSRPATSGQSAAPRATAPAPGDGTLRPGDSGAGVRALQERLFAQGFTYVSPSGVYDEQTRRGVSQFQSDRSLTGDPSGIYGPRTRAAMEGR